MKWGLLKSGLRLDHHWEIDEKSGFLIVKNLKEEGYFGKEFVEVKVGTIPKKSRTSNQQWSRAWSV